MPFKPLSEVTSIKQGRYLASDEMSAIPKDSFSIPVWGANGILGYAREATYEKPVPLVTCRGNGCGLVQWTNGRANISNNAMAVIPIDKSDTRYLYYALLASDFNPVITGSAQPQITVTNLSTLEVGWVSEKQERDAIAHILGTLDDKIELNRRQNETLEAMARALFRAWFVDFEPVRAKMDGRWQRGQSLPGLPAHLYDLFPDRLVESELGAIPEGWKVVKIKTVLKRLSAKVRYKKDQVLSYGKTPVFEQGSSIFLGFHNKEAFYQATAENPAFVFGDHTCITRLSCQPFDISQNVIALRSQGLPTVWVYYAINGKQQFEEYRRHWRELISKDMIVAPLDICSKFSELATRFHIKVEQNERSSQTLYKQCDTLLPKLISGELRIADPDVFLKERGLLE